MKFTFTLLFYLLALSCFSQQAKDSVFVFYFKTAQFELPADSLLKFRGFIKKFDACKSCRFELQGFADKHGDSKSNLILAKHRIAFVRQQLPKIDSSRIVEVPLGEKYSQKAVNHQDYRKVILQVRATKQKNSVVAKTTENAKTSESGNTKNQDQSSTVLSPEEYLKQVAAAKAKIPDTLTKVEARLTEFSERNKPIILSIQFELNTTNLLPESLDDLVILRNYLHEHPNLKAKLIGHVCCSNDYELSRNRAYQIYFYLYKKGINRDRLTYEGKSNRQPLVIETTPAAEQINRRVEVVFYE